MGSILDILAARPPVVQTRPLPEIGMPNLTSTAQRSNPVIPPPVGAVRPRAPVAPVAPAKPVEKRSDTLLRGIGNFLGYIPKGGTRGDRTELIADFARGLLGEKPLREEEAEINQRMAEEMLRRAIATGDPAEIAMLDPAMALQLKQLGTFDEDYEFTRADRVNQLTAAATKDRTERADLDAEAEERRIAAATRLARGLYSDSGGDPEVFKRKFNVAREQNPNLYTSTEAALGMENPQALLEYLKPVLTTPTGSAPKPVVANIAGLGEVYLDAITREPLIYNGQYVRPGSPLQYINQGDGLGFLFNPRPNPDVNPNVYGAPGVGVPVPAPTGAPAQDVIGPGFPPPPSIPVGAPVAGGQPGLSNVPRTTEEIAAAKAQVAGAVAGAETRARLSAEVVDQMIQNEAPLAAFLNSIEAFEKLPDEDISLITGNPFDLGKLARGGFGGLSYTPTAENEDPAPPSVIGTRGAAVAAAYKEVSSKLRLAGFNSVKGAGQVTQAESKFAADALAALRDGRWSSTEDLMRIINDLKTTVIAAQQTQQARLAALRAGDDEWAMSSSDEAIEYLRAKYAGAQQPRAVATQEELRTRVPAPNARTNRPSAPVVSQYDAEIAKLEAEIAAADKKGP